MPHELRVLLDGLAAADPSVRDGWAYAELAEEIENGHLNNEWERIRATALEHLESTQVQARAFAPLILTWLVVAGDRDRNAFEAVARWYPVEPDTRGYDVQLGWLHAVAHGADYLGECARANVATGREVLDLLAARLLGPGSAWRDQEYARIAHAAVLALGSCTDGDAAGWLDPVNAALDDSERAGDDEAGGRPPAWTHNAFTTLTTLYVALAERPQDGHGNVRINHADHVRGTLARTVSRMAPWLVMPRIS